jgi:NADH-quinone oxidoreductase subunit M
MRADIAALDARLAAAAPASDSNPQMGPPRKHAANHIEHSASHKEGAH